MAAAALAAVLLVDPRVATWDRDRFLINASLDAGAGWMSRWDEGIPAMFAVRADVEEFERIFLSTVAGRLVIHSRPRPDLIVRFDGRRCVVNSVVLPAGDVVVRFGNDSSDGASVVILGLPGTTYEQLVRAIGPPGSAVARRPEGVRQIGWLRAGPHVRTLGRVAAPPGDAGIFCLIESTDGTANVWPGGPIRFEG